MKEKKSLITEKLGLFGWIELEPIILASLASEYPMLLIGEHGVAKSFALNRIAKILDMEYRSYNASLINYDDLVGIPIPSDDHKSINYIGSNNSIWDAEIVFIDEINRTKPELQNKLFPIIYDRKIQGESLTKLKYCWAAMNPPYNSDDEYEESIEYLGTVPLDKALSDRFSFIIEIPNWSNLNDIDKANILKDTFMENQDIDVSIKNIIDEIKIEQAKIKEEYLDYLSNIIVFLMNLLNDSFGYISTRRATMLLKNATYVHASRIVINRYQNIKKEVSIDDSFIISTMNSLPYIADKKIDKIKLHKIVCNVIQQANASDNYEKKLALIKNPNEKMEFVLKNRKEIDPIILSNTITNGLSSIKMPYRKALSLVSYLALRSVKNIPASLIETLVRIIKDVFTPLVDEESGYINLPLTSRVMLLSSEVFTDKVLEKYHKNLLNSLIPYGYKDLDEVDKLSDYFIKLYRKVKIK